MPWGAEMGGGCVTATFLGFGSILPILVAESQQGWDKWDQPLGHGHREEGTCHPWMCRVTTVSTSLGGILPSERWECVTLALCVHVTMGCPVGDGMGGSATFPLRGYFPFPALLPTSMGTAV